LLQAACRSRVTECGDKKMRRTLECEHGLVLDCYLSLIIAPNTGVNHRIPIETIVRSYEKESPRKEAC
jgi:hypothetical protein